jgi:hypothetical protein
MLTESKDEKRERTLSSPSCSLVAAEAKGGSIVQ